MWLSFAAASAIGVFFLRRRTKVCLALICLCAFAAGGLRLYYAQAAYEALPRNLAGTVQKLKLCINEKKGAYETDKGKETKYIADLLEPGGRGRIYLTVKGDDPYEPGAVVEGNLRLRELMLYKNEGSYDFFHYYRRKAVFLRAREKKSGDVHLVAEATGYEAYIGNIRRKITDSFKQTLTDTDAYMLTSLLFGGHYDKLPPELLQSFFYDGHDSHPLRIGVPRNAAPRPHAVFGQGRRPAAATPADSLRSLCRRLQRPFRFYGTCYSFGPHGARQCLRLDGKA